MRLISQNVGIEDQRDSGVRDIVKASQLDKYMQFQFTHELGGVRYHIASFSHGMNCHIVIAVSVGMG